MKGRNYPIVLGHPFRKGIIVGKRPLEHGSVYLCRLNREIPEGAEFEKKDIESVEAELWFTTKSSVDITIEMLRRLRDAWEDEENGHSGSA